jgi:hypothetical protein
MNYCNITTRNHPVSISNNTCLESINNIVSREGGPNGTFQSNQIGLNLDMVEHNSRRAQLRPTMDFCFGISQNLRNQQIVLTELKLNVDKPRKITRSDIEDKVNGSIVILTRAISIHQVYYFVFRPDNHEQARRHFASLYNNNPRSPYKTTILADLFNTFFN